MKKINPFVIVNLHTFRENIPEDEISDMHFTCLDDGVDSMKEIFDDIDHTHKVEKIKGDDYNKRIIGSPIDEYNGEIIDRECEKCGHLIAKSIHSVTEHFYCSNYDSAYSEGEYDDGFEKIMSKKSLRVYDNISFEDYKKKYGFDDHKVCEKCEKCGNSLVMKEYYLMENDYATITYRHEKETDCDSGLFIAVPLGKMKEKWDRII